MVKEPVSGRWYRVRRHYPAIPSFMAGDGMPTSSFPACTATTTMCLESIEEDGSLIFSKAIQRWDRDMLLPDKKPVWVVVRHVIEPEDILEEVE